MTIQGAYKEIQGWELPSYAEPSRKKVLETIAEYIDAVPVVRCKDCKHRKSVWHKDLRMKDGGYYYCYCKLDTGDPYALGKSAEEDDWFCADGERKTE